MVAMSFITISDNGVNKDVTIAPLTNDSPGIYYVRVRHALAEFPSVYGDNVIKV